MTWQEVLQVGASVIVSVGGGGAIVFGLSGVLGNIWVQRLKGDIDAKLQRLDAALKHRGFVLQRFAEYELEGLVECWRAARACLPLINATRPDDSGTDEAVLSSNYSMLGDAHNKLIEILGRHEPFLPDPIVENLDAMGQVVRMELSNIKHRPAFQGTWWEDGARNREQFSRLNVALKAQVRQRFNELRAASEEGF